MPQKIQVNIGFVTNSSSVVHHFPRQILEDPGVRAFMAAYQLQDGFVGDDLWNRSACESLLLTKEQRERARVELSTNEYCSGPAVDADGDDVIVIYGDEHHGVAMELCSVMGAAADRLGLSHGGEEYN